MEITAKTPTYLCNYSPPAFLVEAVDLRFELDDEGTVVNSSLRIRRIGNGVLVLDGRNLILCQLAIDGRELTNEEYLVTAETLTIHHVPDVFVLDVVTVIFPKTNTALKGLYGSNGNLCTQCEPEGFREITYYFDRPDVMAPFTTTLIADQQLYPILLSNGNPAASGELPNGCHYAKWVDPFPKPAYLFALVAGDLVCVSDTYFTSSNHKIDLHIYVQRQNQDQCAYALTALKQAMRWDEQVYGREYDLQVYQIVAVDFFNMGAMENKGLNIFNSRYVLARPEIATDEDFENIAAVIAHEYFHNWSGNRVTCRDWFQLSLKEGFTVFRDQQFTADLTSPAVKRIKDAQRLRTAQFREDAGPLAHPVRPDTYLEINNFYTVTIYEKGAEVVRMAYQLLGAAAFRRATDLYFARHDGQAVTTDDFVRALADASGRDLTQFRLWYTQAGTPTLTCHGEYDATSATYTLTVEQHCPPTPHQPTKAPFHIPLALGLLDSNGADLPLRLAGETIDYYAKTRILELRAQREVFKFIDIDAPPLPSLLRGFSAPVKIEIDYSDNDLAFLMAHDSDLFNRWDAGQQLATRVIKRLIADYDAGRQLVAPALLIDAMAIVLNTALPPVDGKNSDYDRRLLAEALLLPSESYLAEQMDPIDPFAIHEVRRFLRQSIAKQLHANLLAVYQINAHNVSNNDSADPIAIGERRLKNICLGYLMEIADEAARNLCMQQFQYANNMTDVIAALDFFVNTNCPERAAALNDFYNRWRHNGLVLDKWFALQATARLPATLENVRSLLKHPDFNLSNPNKVRAVIGSFCHANPVHFHDPSGKGYDFLAEQIMIIDPRNPQIAARLISAASGWRRYEPIRRNAMRQMLEKILHAPNLSKDVYEIISKSLN